MWGCNTTRNNMPHMTAGKPLPLDGKTTYFFQTKWVIPKRGSSTIESIILVTYFLHIMEEINFLCTGRTSATSAVTHFSLQKSNLGSESLHFR